MAYFKKKLLNIPNISARPVHPQQVKFSKDAPMGVVTFVTKPVGYAMAPTQTQAPSHRPRQIQSECVQEHRSPV
jgi:hypothetical protein